MKLGTLHHILNPMTVTWPKIEIFKIQDGGGRHLENRFFGHYSSTDCPISTKFCMRKQNGMLIRDKKCKFLKSKMADGRHFENCQIAISQFKIIRFRWNSVHYSKCWTRLQSPDQKLIVLKFKMVATPSWKSWNHHISVKLLLYFYKIWCTTVYIKPDEVFKSAIAVSLSWFSLLRVGSTIMNTSP